MQRAAGAADEPGAVEEDAGPIDHAGVGTGAIAEDATLARLGVTLEAVRVQRGSECGDHPGFVDIAQVGTDRAAPEAEMRRRLRADALATSTPQASPPRRQELPVEAPDRVTVVDLLHRRGHPTSLRRSTRRRLDASRKPQSQGPFLLTGRQYRAPPAEPHVLYQPGATTATPGSAAITPPNPARYARGVSRRERLPCGL